MWRSDCIDCGKLLSGQNVSGYCRRCFASHAEFRGFRTDSIAAGRNEAARLYPLDDIECERCEGLATERHHIDGNTLNNMRSNIEFLCKPCHTRQTLRDRWSDPKIRTAQVVANRKTAQIRIKRSGSIRFDRT